MGHELGDQQSLVTLAAAANEVGKPLAPELPHRSRLLLRAHQETDRNQDTRKKRENKERKGKKKNGKGTDEELARVGPGELVEALDGDGAVAVEEVAAVDDVGGLLAVLRDDVVWGEAIGCRPKLLQPELGKPRHAVPIAVAAILCSSH